MSLKQPLKRRIVIAFFIMTLVVAGTSSISIFIIVQMLEENFFSQELVENLQDILDRPLAHDEIAKLCKNFIRLMLHSSYLYLMIFMKQRKVSQRFY